MGEAVALAVEAGFVGVGVTAGEADGDADSEGDPSHPQLLVTVRGLGYKLDL